MKKGMEGERKRKEEKDSRKGDRQKKNTEQFALISKLQAPNTQTLLREQENKEHFLMSFIKPVLFNIAKKDPANPGTQSEVTHTQRINGKERRKVNIIID